MLTLFAPKTSTNPADSVNRPAEADARAVATSAGPHLAGAAPVPVRTSSASLGPRVKLTAKEQVVRLFKEGKFTNNKVRALKADIADLRASLQESQRTQQPVAAQEPAAAAVATTGQIARVNFLDVLHEQAKTEGLVPLPPPTVEMKATRELGQWAANIPAKWSPEVRSLATHAWEDTIASAIAGAGDRGTDILRSSVNPSGSVPVIGGSFCTSAADAALVNGYAAHAVEMDENFLIGLGHLCAVVVPAILAVGHEVDAKGHQALDALIVASEVIARIGRAMGRAHTDRGWHGTSTLGALAAAAACGRLLGLNAEAMTHALAIAVSMSAGPKVQFGTPTKPLHAGMAAQAGVRAAQLAQSGLRANEQALEGRYGFGDLYAGIKPANWSAVTPKPDDPLAIQSAGMAFKLWPSCGATHKAIAGVLALRQEHGFSAEDVASVQVQVAHGIMVNLRYPAPEDHKQAQFSMNYAIALALRFGDLTLAHYTPQAVQDPATRALLPLVSMVKHPSSKEGSESVTSLLPHEITVSLKDGTVHKRSVQHMKGGLGDPLTAEDRRAKFDMCCAKVLPADQLDTIRRMLAEPEQVSIRQLSEQLMFEAGGDDGERFSRDRK